MSITTNVTPINTTVPVNGLSRGAVKVLFSCGTWTARKLDKKVTEETNTRKRASQKASRTHKSLLPDAVKLDAVIQHGAMVRKWVYTKTMPWDNAGNRVLPTLSYYNPAEPTDFKREMNKYEAKFWQLVDDFVNDYSTLISKQAFELGDMFDRSEYPTEDQIRSKFSFFVDYEPLPLSGDFRIDLANDAMQDLKDEYDQKYAARFDSAVADIRGRLIAGLKHLSDRFGDGETRVRKNPSKKLSANCKTFNSDILDNFVQMLSDVKELNIMADPDIQRMLVQAENAIRHVDVSEIRKYDDVRTDVKVKVDSILDKFDF